MGRRYSHGLADIKAFTRKSYKNVNGAAGDRQHFEHGRSLEIF
ncbi:hypothetical protein [Tumidithrix helvetica]